MKLLHCVVIGLILFAVADANILGTRQKLRVAAQHQINFDATATDTMLIDTAAWNEFVNRACVKVAYDANILYKESSLVTDTGVRPYLLDTAILDVKYVVRVRNNHISSVKRWHPALAFDKFEIKEISYGKPNAFPIAPSGYWLYGDSIYFWPTPIYADTMLVGYTIYPAHLSAEATATNIPLQFREAIVWYTCYLALMSVPFGSMDASAYLQAYNEEIQKYIFREQDKYDERILTRPE